MGKKRRVKRHYAGEAKGKNLGGHSNNWDRKVKGESQPTMGEGNLSSGRKKTEKKLTAPLVERQKSRFVRGIFQAGKNRQLMGRESLSCKKKTTMRTGRRKETREGLDLT